MKTKPRAAVLAAFLIGVVGIVALMGCRPEEADIIEEQYTEGGSQALAVPFHIADMARDTITDATASNLEPLFPPGMAILFLAFLARLLLGTWRDAFIVSLVGMVPVAGGVLFSEYPRVVLLIPAALVAVGIAYAAKLLVEWRTGFLAWKASSSLIEEGDTGPASWGQGIKNRFRKAGLAPVLDKGVRLMEKIWAKQKERS